MRNAEFPKYRFKSLEKDLYNLVGQSSVKCSACNLEALNCHQNDLATLLRSKCKKM